VGRLGPLFVALVTGGCALLFLLGGGGGGDTSSAGFLPGSSRAGAGGGLSQVPVATCGQWTRGSPAQRRTVIEELGDHFNHKSTFAPGAKLDDDEAYGVIERGCRIRGSEWVKLYKIYARALAFHAYVE
jgi:hypothetical protein